MYEEESEAEVDDRGYRVVRFGDNAIRVRTRNLDNETAQVYERRTRYSEWLVTVNTNKTFEDEDQRRTISAAVIKAVDKVFTQEIPLAYRINPKEEREMYLRDTPAENIQKVKTLGASEVGQKYKKLHVHVVLSVKHNTNLEINMNAAHQRLKYWVNAYTRGVVSRPYMNIRFLRSSQGNAIDYIQKGQYRASDYDKRGWFNNNRN